MLSPHGLLIIIALGYGGLVLYRVPSLVALTWDEVVYASQVRPGVAAVPMSAPRAWGMPVILAPVASLTTSIPVIRLYLSALAVIGLYAAYRPWLGVLTAQEAGTGAGTGTGTGTRSGTGTGTGSGTGTGTGTGRGAARGYAVPIAAALFCTLWTTLLYGAMAYPNLWLAFALVAGVGWFCRGLTEPRRAAPLAGMAVAFAAASLLRPTDAAALAAPLLVVALVRRDRRVLAVGAGLAVGWGVWAAEAFARFGDPLQRLRAGAEINEPGLGFSLLRHLEAVDGPLLLCRPAEACADIHWFEVAWWFVLPVLVVLGILAARGAGRTALLLVVACVVTFALPYLLLFSYANPRFMQPAYALLMIPAGVGVARLLTRRVALVLVPVALVAHVAGQVVSLDRVTGRMVPVFVKQRAQADAMLEQGVRPRCVLVGQGAIQLGYLTGCRSLRTAEDPAPGDPAVAAAAAGGEQVVLLVREEGAEAPAGWTALSVPDTSVFIRQGANGS